MKLLTHGLLLCLFFWTAALCRAEGPSLETRLRPLIDRHAGQVAVSVKHLKTGQTFHHRETAVMPTASLIKVAVMIEAYRKSNAGELRLDSLVTVTAEDKVPGSGILTPHFSAGIQLPVRDALRLMIAYSDNTATNLVLDQVGIAAVGETMNRLGFPNTRIHAKVFKPMTSIAPERSQKYGLGSTSSGEMIQIFEALSQGNLVSPAASAEMLAHLQTCDDSTRLRRFLPPGTKVAEKTGSVTEVRTTAGLIETQTGPVAVCVLTSANKDTRWIDDNAGNQLCADIGREVYQWSATPDPTSTIPTELKLGDHGQLVMDLQRTLNARLKPSPKLSVDGEFGSVTELAVQRLQKEKLLKETGVVDSTTWDALGVLVTAAEPVESPEVINSQVLETRPADPVTGPPIVTCCAWAIADAKTGAPLWNEKGDVRLEPASTTKVLTAYMVFKLAAADPKVLDELVVFSERADSTGGSTSDLREGEKLPVRELLYGLLLPSGNDASVALAEHFGRRFPGAEGDTSYDHFIAQMNRTAKSLEMNGSSFRNPHGLPHPEHYTTANDLLKLSYAAMRSEEYRQYVSTRQRGATVTGRGGYKRNVVWKNTNQLLEIDGYRGVKTGTTGAAGACLVSHATRGEDELLCVVLGASNNEARYVDTRNLFKWAWNERGQK